MARIPTRRPRARDLASSDPPRVDDRRPSRDPPPIEPDWANDARPSDATPEPYEPTWAKEQPRPAAAPPRSDPPWAAQSVIDNDAALRAALAETPPPDPPPRPPVILRGPIDPPWVPDDVSVAIAAQEKAARAAFEPDWAKQSATGRSKKPIPRMEPSWVDDVAPTPPVPGALFDPGWESTPIAVPLPPMEPDWADEIDEAGDDFAAAFDPGWEETAWPVASVPLPPMEPSWAVEVQSEVEQARSDIFEAPLERDGSIVAPDKMSILKGAQRLRGIAAQVSLNPFGRAKKKNAARQIEREKLIADAMRIRTETREALGEETVNALYRSIMGTDPPEDER